MSPIITDELVEAIYQLREAKTRDPPLGFKRGQAVGPRDKAARGILLDWLADKFPDSLLHWLSCFNPVGTLRVFNEFLDERSNYEDTMEECYQRAKNSGHAATALEWCSMSMLLDEALFILNSPLDG
jgi:hypothetical protein